MQYPICIHAFKDHIYCGYNDGLIKMLELSNYDQNFSAKFNAEKSFSIIGCPLKIMGHRDKLFILTESQLYVKENSKTEPVLVKEFEKCDFFDISKKNNSLFLYSHKNGLIILKSLEEKNTNERVSYTPQYEDLFNNEVSGDVTKLLAERNSIYYSVRGKGLFRFIYKNNSFEEYKMNDLIQKTDLRDIQDFIIDLELDRVVVLDMFKGLLIFNLNFSELIRHDPDVSSYGPREILKHGNNYIINTRLGLFHYNFRIRNIEAITNKKIGDFAKYYNVLYYISGQNVEKINLNNYSRI